MATLIALTPQRDECNRRPSCNGTPGDNDCFRPPSSADPRDLQVPKFTKGPYHLVRSSVVAGDHYYARQKLRAGTGTSDKAPCRNELRT